MGAPPKGMRCWRGNGHIAGHRQGQIPPRHNQIAYFGDTMNVAARLCDHTKAAGEALVASAEMLKGAAIPCGLSVGSPANIPPRSRQTPVEFHAVHRTHEVWRRAAHAPTPD
jgi:class 3 adenylate cyclase